MKCKIIKVTMDIALTKPNMIEDAINIWLKENPTVDIKYITQAGIAKTVITTIFYE